MVGWKKTFVFDWRDYEKSFEVVLESFDAHGKILERLLGEWQKNEADGRLASIEGTSSETRRRVNDEVLRQNRLLGISNTVLDISNATNLQLSEHASQFGEFRETIKTVLREYEQNRFEMISRAEAEEKRRKEEQKETVLAWLKTAGEHQSTYHNMFLEVRKDFPETAVWILDEMKIFNWMNEEIPNRSVMWLNGKKGAGKPVVFIKPEIV